MDTYKIVWKKSALKELKYIPQIILVKVIEKIEQLAFNPYPIGSKKIIGSQHTFRVKVQSYRILYNVINNQITIEIIRVAHRKKAYK